MNNDNGDGKCKHAGCACVEIGADDYCCVDCRIADENSKQGSCTCGHTECSVADSSEAH